MIEKKKLYAIILIAAITVGILVPVLLLRGPGGGPSDDTIYYTGDHVFTTSLIVGTDQKVVFQNGEFNFTGDANLTVFGILEMHNVIFHGNLTAFANGTVLLDTTTVNSYLTFKGNSSGTIQNAEVSCNITAYDTAVVTIINSDITTLVSYMSALIAVQDSWATDLTLDGNASITATNLSISNILYTYGQVIASLENVTVAGFTYLRHNSTVSLTDAVLNGYLYTYNYVKLTIRNSSLLAMAIYDNSEINVTHCSSTSIINMYQWSIATLHHFTTSSGFYLWGNSNTTLINSTTTSRFYTRDNAQLTLINSTVDIIFDYTNLISGTWTIDNNVLSGTGISAEPIITIINSTYTSIEQRLNVVSSTKATINNSIFNEIITRNTANLTLHNTNVVILQQWDDSLSDIRNTTIFTGNFETNNTVYLEDVIFTDLNAVFDFYKGNIAGYNTTFVGIESGDWPKMTLGSNVSYTTLYCEYYLYNQINLSLTNTNNFYLESNDYSNVSLTNTSDFDLNTYSNSNVSLTNSSDFYLYTYGNSNVSLTNSSAFYLYPDHDSNVSLFSCYNGWMILAFGNANLTLYDTSVDQLHLLAFSFAAITMSSHVTDLNLYDFSGNYTSTDSTVTNFYDWR
ncbi:MAG: hypothetical protein HWN66_06680 [Candidatus Helarchaeota archaeon]|nr:hypothetical protein [Candidatus Helarchaeota archaeon]